ncbi:DapH/DapD/GlmU-related protein [Leptolyngbya sp. FACHB-261]|uniref:acyltransferase n=1 Tax=Leptolyngbya sp. FACHB-261 TaxID=2692806 RepID=UPI001689B7A1|nr:acyltransferase [Leptolyngbya sp. FACHB-261]MBD2102695.1 acyltransferase [Leptolyngbya sp. FACHB-261]
MGIKRSDRYRHYLRCEPVSHWAYLKEALLLGLLSRFPGLPGIVLRNWFYRPIFARIGSFAFIHANVEFRCATSIQIGNRAVLEQNVFVNGWGPSSHIYIGDSVTLDQGVNIRAHKNGHIQVGRGSYIGPYTCLSGPNIDIGKDCLIASHSGIYANNHSFDDPTLPIKKQDSTYKGIVIEDDCWLGTGVKVLDGVTIGRGSVIGAGAVVTRDIPPGSVAVGVPAKVVSRRSASQMAKRTTEPGVVA